ncbi:MAG: LCP family protein [Lachnospiraceae bacterium]|nr:LCP family protein [Lachnospiraceae bacterium]
MSTSQGQVLSISDAGSTALSTTNVQSEATAAFSQALDTASITPISDEKVKNILFIGQDHTEDEDQSGAGSLILLSIDFRNSMVSMVSIMRNMYVAIPGQENSWLNQAYISGGTSLLDDSMKTNLGIQIDGNVEVSLDEFISSMAQLGDLDIELDQAEADYLNTSDWAKEQAASLGTTTDGWNLAAGSNSLTPEQMRIFSRIGHIENSSKERTDRQRMVMIAVFEKLKKTYSTEDAVSMIDQALSNATTDMDDDTLLNYIYSLIVYQLPLYSDHSFRVPLEGTYTNETLSGGTEVQVPDLKANADRLRGVMYAS